MIIDTTLRRAAAAIAALGLAALLSACMLTSEQNLVSPDEAVQPLPATFAMQTYSDGEAGYVRTADGVTVYTLAGGGYADPEGNTTAYFVPLEGNTYLLGIPASDGAMYGLARLRDGIMEIRMVFGTDPAEELATAGIATPGGVVFADGGAMVTDRAGLDAMIALMRDGTVKTSPLIAWVGEGDPPASIIADGDWYKAQ